MDWALVDNKSVHKMATQGKNNLRLNPVFPVTDFKEIKKIDRKQYPFTYFQFGFFLHLFFFFYKQKRPYKNHFLIFLQYF